MHRIIRRVSLPRFAPTARRIAQPNICARIASPAPPFVRAGAVTHRDFVTAWDFGPNPYVDYGRVLTPEGGIRLTCKDFDLRLRHMLWSGVAWTAATWLEAYSLASYEAPPVSWSGFGCLLSAALLNWLIVAKPVEIHRMIEIRPDCLVIEYKEIFWLRYMENGWPSLQADDDDDDRFVLRGIYGSRAVDFLTLRRFGKFDKAPEVFAAHLQDAINQLWAPAPQR